MELFGSYDPDYDHDFQEPLGGMRRRSNLHEDSTDNEDLDGESIDILSVTPTPERLVFSSGEELYDYVEGHCRNHGYIVSRDRTRFYKASNSSDKQLKSMEIKCDLGGKNSSKSTGKRLAKSRRCDCPFKWKTSKKTLDQDGSRVEQWTLVIENSGHSHEAAEILSGHSRACVLNGEQFNIVKEMSDTGSGAQEILSYLQNKYPAQDFRPTTIYNARQASQSQTS